MTKLNYSKVTGSEQDSHNKVGANSTNNAVKNPEIQEFGILSIKQQNGSLMVPDSSETVLILTSMLMLHVFKYAIPGNMHKHVLGKNKKAKHLSAPLIYLPNTF